MISTLSFGIKELIPYINWIYFFHTWQISAKVVNTIVGKADESTHWDESTRAQYVEGKKLHQDAQEILQIFNTQYKVSCRIGLFDANSNNDDIIIDSHMTIPCLRQQHATDLNKPNLCLSDFIIPLSTGRKDRIGVFASTVPLAMEESYAPDEYKHLMAQTLSDRLAEAATEKAHLKVRKELWGYAPDEDLSIDDLFSEKWQGIRPAVGYPSLPDLSINFLIDKLIDMKDLGITLTENGAMKPHASVSGFMISHPKATYFSIGKIGNDQIQDYSQRRGLPAEQLKRFLSANTL